MGRRRQYGSEAERQRACRQRREEETVRVDRGALEGLHRRLDGLQAAMSAAANGGDETARVCVAASVETMLEKLTAYFRARVEESRSLEERGPAPALSRKASKRPKAVGSTSALASE